QRDEREQHRSRAERDEDRRDELPALCASGHAADSAAGTTTAAASCLTGRAMLQMRRRDRELTMSVMMKSTRPISISAFRYNAVSASVNSLASTAAIVCCGASNDHDAFALLPITIVTAIVSP